MRCNKLWRLNFVAKYRESKWQSSVMESQSLLDVQEGIWFSDVTIYFPPLPWLLRYRLPKSGLRSIEIDYCLFCTSSLLKSPYSLFLFFFHFSFIFWKSKSLTIMSSWIVLRSQKPCHQASSPVVQCLPCSKRGKRFERWLPSTCWQVNVYAFSSLHRIDALCSHSC